MSYTDSNRDGVIADYRERYCMNFNINNNCTRYGMRTVKEVLEENHYFPFGLKHKKYNSLISKFEKTSDNDKRGPHLITQTELDYKYKYNGKEWQDELGLNMYSMDFRQYDPAIARWVVVDPIVHHSMSPYNAFDNNPVYFADPSGANSIYNFNTNQYVINGEVVTFEQALAYTQDGGNADGTNDNTPRESSPEQQKINNLTDMLFEFRGSEKDKLTVTLTNLDRSLVRNFESEEYVYYLPRWYRTKIEVKGVEIHLFVEYTLMKDKNSGKIRLYVSQSQIHGSNKEGYHRGLSVREANCGGCSPYGISFQLAYNSKQSDGSYRYYTPNVAKIQIIERDNDLALKKMKILQEHINNLR